MKNYIVGVKEIYEVSVSVEANSIEEAIEKAKIEIESGNNDEMEYSHTMDSRNWNVYEEAKPGTGIYKTINTGEGRK